MPPRDGPHKISPIRFKSNGPVNFRGDPVSAEQARPEKGLEDVMMPHEYLEGAAGLAGLAEHAPQIIKGISGGIKSLPGIVRDLPGAWAEAKGAFKRPENMAGLFRQIGEQQGGDALFSGERLARDVESTPLTTRLKEAAQAAWKHQPAAARTPWETKLVQDAGDAYAKGPYANQSFEQIKGQQDAILNQFRADENAAIAAKAPKPPPATPDIISDGEPVSKAMFDAPTQNLTPKNVQIPSQMKKGEVK